jgi:hypothetical protein
MPALPPRDSNNGSSSSLLHDLSGTTRLIDIVGPIMPPYEANVSLHTERGDRVDARAPVTATDDPSPELVRAELKRREACRGDAGQPSNCHFPAPGPGRDQRLTGVTAASLARSVAKSLANQSAGLAVDSVACRRAWSCTAQFTLGYGRHRMRVTYRLRGAGAPKCWRVSGWSFRKAGPSGAALPTPSTGCIQTR